MRNDGMARLKKEQAHDPREPLMTLHELAADFGVKPKALSNYMRRPACPGPEFPGKFNVRRMPYYRPSVMRAWWKTIDRKP